MKVTGFIGYFSLSNTFFRISRKKYILKIFFYRRLVFRETDFVDAGDGRDGRVPPGVDFMNQLRP
jgi:hypothetical protein